jgi:2-dehydropantoate 2-reductase
MAQDIRKGRRTETEWINGLVARRGRELGVEASVHDRVNAVLKRIEAGELAPSPALLNGL